MEKTLDKGENKIQKICDALRKETLDPAKEEADRLVEEAKVKAEQIIKDAHIRADKQIADGKSEIERERRVFHSSLDQATRQALEELRQTIEHHFFNNELQTLILKKSADPEILSKLIEAIVKAIDKEGLSTDLSAIIPKVVPAEEVNRLIAQNLLAKLQGGGVELGEFFGGAQVKLHDKKMTIDITDRSLMELLSRYVRKDFRKFLFKS